MMDSDNSEGNTCRKILQFDKCQALRLANNKFKEPTTEPPQTA